MRDDGLADDVLSSSLGRVSLPPKGDDPLHIRQGLEVLPLIVRVIDNHVPSC